MDRHTESLADTLKVLEQFAGNSASTQKRVSRLESEVEDLRTRLDNLEEAS